MSFGYIGVANNPAAPIYSISGTDQRGAQFTSVLLDPCGAALAALSWRDGQECGEYQDTTCRASLSCASTRKPQRQGDQGAECGGLPEQRGRNMEIADRQRPKEGDQLLPKM